MAKSRTQIIIALIGLVGVITAATIANLDKLTPNSPGVADLPSRTAGNAPLEQLPPPSATGIPDIDGWWHDDEGNRFAFTQKGTRYDFVQYSGTQRVGTGQGVLTGRGFEHRFHVDDFGDGTCTGAVADDGQTTSGRCEAGSKGAWKFTVSRGYQ